MLRNTLYVNICWDILLGGPSPRTPQAWADCCCQTILLTFSPTGPEIVAPLWGSKGLAVRTRQYYTRMHAWTFEFESPRVPCMDRCVLLGCYLPCTTQHIRQRGKSACEASTILYYTTPPRNGNFAKAHTGRCSVQICSSTVVVVVVNSCMPATPATPARNRLFHF